MIHYKIINDINLPIGYYTTHFAEYKTLALKSNDEISIQELEYQDTDRTNRKSVFLTYKNVRMPTTTSIEFFKINEKVFSDITEQVNRDRKIKSILDEVNF
jgi:hypothetical protein